MKKKPKEPMMLELKLINHELSRYTDVRRIDSTPREEHCLNNIVRTGDEHYFINMLTQNASLYPRW